jgi:hypothetical protein
MPSLLFVRVLCAVSDDIHFAFNYIDYIMNIYSFKSVWYYNAYTFYKLKQNTAAM